MDQYTLTPYIVIASLHLEMKLMSEESKGMFGETVKVVIPVTHV